MSILVSFSNQVMVLHSLKVVGSTTGAAHKSLKVKGSGSIASAACVHRHTHTDATERITTAAFASGDNKRWKTTFINCWII